MLKLNSVSHEVAGRSLFSDLNFVLGRRRYGLVGPNGVGKSTLARIMAGQTQPTIGQVTLSSHVRYFAQEEPRDASSLSEYLQGLWHGDGKYRRFVKELVDPLNFERALPELSGGEWMRARLANCLADAPGGLILDEPSNNLDQDGRLLLIELIEIFEEGLVLISHDRELLNRVDETIELSNQGVSFYGGGFSFYCQEREAERARRAAHLEAQKKSEQKAREKRRQEFERQAKRMRKGAARVAEEGIPRIVASAMKRNAQATHGAIVKKQNKKVQLQNEIAVRAWTQLKNDPFLRLDFEAACPPKHKLLASVRALNWRYAEETKDLWKNPIDFAIRGQERWHITGRNGTGKSTFVQLLADRGRLGHGRVSGVIDVRTQAIGFLDQRCGMLAAEKSILENIQEVSRFPVVELRNELAFYGFIGESVFQRVNTLSGGELLRAALARIFLGSVMPELLIFDEPTNNLDLASIELLESALQRFSGAVILVSHDTAFVEKLSITNSLGFA